MTADELRRAEAAFRKAYKAFEEARERRNQLILAARAAGWSHQEIAQATGLTRSRSSQIARGVDHKAAA